MREATNEDIVHGHGRCPAWFLVIPLQASANWLEVIQDESLHAVVIGTWPYLHRTLVLQALQHGKHVLTEARLVCTDLSTHVPRV